MTSLLFFSRYIPGERFFGSDTRQEQVLRSLGGLGIDIHLVQVIRSGDGEGTAPSRHALVASITRLPLEGAVVSGPQPVSWQYLARPRTLKRIKRLWTWTGWQSEPSPLRRRLARLLDRTKAQIVWIDHGDLSPLLELLPPGRPLLKIVDTHDVMHARDASFQAAGLPPESGINRQQEQELLGRSDVVVAIQEEEAKILAEMLPRQRIIVLGHAARVDPQSCTSSDVCFVGSEYCVNETSLLTFLSRAWPAIRRQGPITRLQVVGGVGRCDSVREAASKDPRIVLRGIVEDVREIYRRPAVVVCPLWIGSGLKIKLVEALAHGKAAVASCVAAQGLEDGADQAFVLAPEPEDFIEPVVRLLQDDAERQSLERCAVEYAAMRFDERIVWAEMRKFLSKFRERQQLRRAA